MSLLRPNALLVVSPMDVQDCPPSSIRNIVHESYHIILYSILYLNKHTYIYNYIYTQIIPITRPT